MTNLRTHRPVFKEPSGQLALGFDPPSVSSKQMLSPAGYKGLSAFHKYWGKKPVECLAFLVDRLTSGADLVVDPFVGSGLIARECAVRDRRFIGIDINPFAIELARLLCDLPALSAYSNAVAEIDQEIRPRIEESYFREDGRIATHYLWDATNLKEIWIAGNGSRRREVFSPSEFDLRLLRSYIGYESSLLRPPRFFQNSRINTTPTLGLRDLFTGRALRNIDLILERVQSYSGTLKRALLLTLTASVGQMSNMVFAITGRGKTNGRTDGKIEVGSWVIGYWRPTLHFEINVWNCFRRRARKLEKALADLEGPASFSPACSVDQVIGGHSAVALINADAMRALDSIPDSCCKLVLTDPPHSDRIPYLELSELWNSVLGLDSDFSNEIVVSNARERSKTKDNYSRRMAAVFGQAERILRPNGILAVLFNARDKQSWESLTALQSREGLRFAGSFPMSYSAGSVVQDNRRGAMKSDYVLIYVRVKGQRHHQRAEYDFAGLPGWCPDFPERNNS